MNKIKMKTIQYIFSCCIAVSVVSGMVSCNKLDEYNPSNATAEEAWSTPEGFVTVVNAAYSEQRSWYGKEDGIFMSESGTDLWYNRDKNSYARQLTRYDGLSAADGNPNKAAWKLLWQAINVCNAGINRIGSAGFTDTLERNKRLGELRFLRGFYYWHVVETYGGVMLRTTETQGPELTATRSSVDDFYKLIFSDLEYAAANLPNDWGAEYSRATKKSALGFLARAYLSRAYYSTGDEARTYFQKARDVANDVINRQAEFRISLWANYADLWNPAKNKDMGNEGGEALYVISNSTDPTLNYDERGNRLFMVFQTPYKDKPGLEQSLEYGFESSRRLMPTRTLLDYFNEEEDSRYEASFQEVWIANKDYTWTAEDVNTLGKDPAMVGKTIRAGIDTALYITKKSIANEKMLPYIVIDRDSAYAAGGEIRNGRDFVTLKKFMDPNRITADSEAGSNDVIVMRLAEMYLIAAEAELQLGNKPGAADMLNVLRKRAAKKTPVDYTNAMIITDPDVIDLDFILAERARELCGENIRWFDVKRIKNGQNGQEAFSAYIKRTNPDITKVEDFHRLRPVPIVEMQALLNADEFGQNPGY